MNFLNYILCRRPKTPQEVAIENKLRVVGYKNPVEYWKKQMNAEEHYIMSEAILFAKHYQQFPCNNLLEQFALKVQDSYKKMAKFQSDIFQSECNQYEMLGYLIRNSNYYYHYYPFAKFVRRWLNKPSLKQKAVAKLGAET